MKRKVYVKQMKMLKEKSKSQQKDEQNEKEPNTKSSETSSSCDTSNESQDLHQEPRAKFTPEQQSTSDHLIPTVVSSTSSKSPWPSASSSTHSNSGPLPTVDVLMKKSTLRAFQLRPNHDSRHDNELAASQSNNTDLHSQPYKQDLPTHTPTLSITQTSSYPEGLENSNVDRWSKDYSSVDQASTMLPKLIHPSYAIETPPTAYNVNLDQAELHTDESATSTGNCQPSSPPVFHQLQQVTRLNDKIVITDTSGVAGYPTSAEHENISLAHHQRSRHQYIAMNTGSEVIHHQQHHQQLNHEIPNYDNSTHHHPHHQHTSNLNDDHFHEHHGQVRAWEQENYRYVDFTWRHNDQEEEEEEESESVYTDMKSTDDEDTHFKQNTNVLDESIDLSNKATTTHRPTTRSGGRRRRKRVQTPVQRSAANMRERRRMCHLNVAFDYLKEHLPNVKDKKKLSRIQTLKAAIYYIHLLQDSLNV